MSGRLIKLLAAIDRHSALAFADAQIGPVLNHDREHGSDLTDQLERALDDLSANHSSRHDSAPGAAPASGRRNLRARDAGC